MRAKSSATSIQRSGSYSAVIIVVTVDRSITDPGEYQFTRFAVRGQTANRRLLALQGRFETGGFYSGHGNQTVLGSP
jgi:hypothetical protein